MLERALAAIPERESPVGGKRILVAEDQRVVARDIQRSLTALGYSVVDLVPSGQAAIDKARELSPNLVLMDIRMPGPIDGIEAARVVVGELGIPVLYLTAFSDLDTLARAKLSKPLGYLLKPFKEAELRCAIEIALHKHESDAAQGERERLLSSTLRSMGDAVVVTDREERVMLMNRAAERLTGWSSDAASGRKATEVVGLLDRRTGSALESPIARAMREGGATVFEDRVTLGRLDATPIPIEQSAAPIVDDGGRVLGGVVVIRDVSERHKAAEEIRRLHVELEQRVVQRTEQLDAAHKELEA
ncbi:MAG TPA: response regulator, partial [Candidatus Acidoferrum sp.]|nr:response regulator [Candidatus Acidoferrum sp.]